MLSVPVKIQAPAKILPVGTPEGVNDTIIIMDGAHVDDENTSSQNFPVVEGTYHPETLTSPLQPLPKKRLPAKAHAVGTKKTAESFPVVEEGSYHSEPIMSPLQPSKKRSPAKAPVVGTKKTAKTRPSRSKPVEEERKCYKCHKSGHVKARCPLNKKNRGGKIRATQEQLLAELEVKEGEIDALIENREDGLRVEHEPEEPVDQTVDGLDNFIFVSSYTYDERRSPWYYHILFLELLIACLSLIDHTLMPIWGDNTMMTTMIIFTSASGALMLFNHVTKMSAYHHFEVWAQTRCIGPERDRRSAYDRPRTMLRGHLYELTYVVIDPDGNPIDPENLMLLWPAVYLVFQNRALIQALLPKKDIVSSSSLQQLLSRMTTVAEDPAVYTMHSRSDALSTNLEYTLQGRNVAKASCKVAKLILTTAPDLLFRSKAAQIDINMDTGFGTMILAQNMLLSRTASSLGLFIQGLLSMLRWRSRCHFVLMAMSFIGLILMILLTSSQELPRDLDLSHRLASGGLEDASDDSQSYSLSNYTSAVYYSLSNQTKGISTSVVGWLPNSTQTLESIRSWMRSWAHVMAMQNVTHTGSDPDPLRT
jgi:hypothetical protein